MGKKVAPAKAPALSFDLAFLERKRGPKLSKATATVGKLVVLGGFVKGLKADARGFAHFTLKFVVQQGDKVLARYEGPVGAPMDLPGEGGVRIDLGVPVPGDTPPGAAKFEVEVVEKGSKARVRTALPFEVQAAPSAPAEPPPPQAQPKK